MLSGMDIPQQMNAVKELLFTIPYMKNQQVLVSKKSQNINQYDMTGRFWVLGSGSSGYIDFEALELLKISVKKIKNSQYQSFNEALIDLQNDQLMPTFN